MNCNRDGNKRKKKRKRLKDEMLSDYLCAAPAQNGVHCAPTLVLSLVAAAAVKMPMMDRIESD